MTAVSLTLQQANAFVNEHHRHHNPVIRDKFRVGAMQDGKLIGVAQVGRPVARGLDDGETVEVVRLCVLDGYRNACSFLYARCANAARELGFKRIVTYILESEPGTSLLASGFRFDCLTNGGSWSCKSRPRETQAPECPKKRFVKEL